MKHITLKSMCYKGHTSDKTTMQKSFKLDRSLKE